MTDAAKTSIEKSVRKTDAVTTEEAQRTSAVVEKVTAADPALMNELNQEPWWQSGVGFFGTGGVIWALGIIALQVGENGTNAGGYDFEVMITAIGALVSTGGVLFRRFVPGLKPMFHRFTK